MSRVKIHVAVAALAGMAAVAAGRGAPSPTLAQVVQRNFESWDCNADGALSPDEVDYWVSVGTVKGEDAAAIATIKLAMRRKTDPISRFTLGDIASGPAVKPSADADESTEEISEEEFDPRTAAELERRFRSAVRKIERRHADIFADQAPDIRTFHQGPLGDCYFVSMVGAMAHHHPEKLAAMIDARQDGSCSVRFAGAAKPAIVDPLTDAQVVIASTAGKDGLWLPIIEHGFGTLRKSTRPDRADDEATDLIARGGYAGETIELLTGHDATRLGLGGSPTKPLSADELAQRAARVRELLPGLLEQKRLVSVGTAREIKLPPGVNQSHAYAVLAYDAGADMVTVWNPHGNNFRPKGPEGLEHGYLTRGGVFKVSTDDLVRIFRGIVWETDQPAVPNPPRKRR